MVFDTRFSCPFTEHTHTHTCTHTCTHSARLLFYVYTECIVKAYKTEQIKWVLVTAVAIETKANKHEIDTRKCKHGGPARYVVAPKLLNKM